MLGHGENSIYEIHQELSRNFPDIDLVQAIVDVKDEAAVDQLFRKYKPAVVFHAAAQRDGKWCRWGKLRPGRKNIF
ncbi:hypothetical protein MTAT_25390 [Moorella thermoacetica]|uniref:Polysaccharide biosynthesis protein n=1 Tax=Neomoorella thermoacetica TaxID=1525 RepID=A0AAC9HG61_NEOTH|nr:polysaccharide biosynthesis protein [Moorella thermoacetica]AOQ23337.1 Polysaccharide biosynthesis protein [Moorella thermoacetica]TYL09454.1 hypothetical protein MTAT_25390 [Moorella thermoacetica]